ncbi:MAG: MBL fold metallo-hydrolase [Clostridia bacterium]|jgi:phosphoribosyl 1,2-cyclic phosphate phosphodiesterase|nr:MBL fold metallo-hydrolase [Clostridia bacterium]
MKIKFLGTGGVMGVPVWNCDCHVCKSEDRRDRRYRSSVLIKIDEVNIIIDFGQDFRNQLIENEIKYINYAFLTHAHRDHVGGIEQLATAENAIFEAPEDVMEEHLAKEGSSRNWLETRNKSITIQAFTKKKIKEYEVDTVKLEHKKDYSDIEVPCYGYVFKSPNFKFAYISDYNKVLEPDKIKNLDLIISDGNGLNDKGHGHVGINGSIKIYKEYKPKRMILTHLKHELTHTEMQEYVEKFGNIEIAYDGLEINN